MSHFWTLVVTFIATVCAAGLIAQFRRRKFVIFIPKLFSFDGLGQGGAFVEITLKNYSKVTEDNIKVQFPQNTPITLIASTDSNVVTEDNTLRLERLSGRQETSVLVHVQSNVFKISDIVNAASNAVEGKIIIGKRSDSTESYTIGDWVQALTGIGVIFGFGIFAGAMFGFIGLLNLPGNIVFSGDRGADYWDNSGKLLFSDYISDSKPKRVPCKYEDPVIGKDFISVEYLLENNADKPIEFTIQIATNSDKDKYNFPHSYETSLFLLPGETRSVTVKDDLPNQAEKFVNLECRWEYEDDVMTDVRKFLRLKKT